MRRAILVITILVLISGSIASANQDDAGLQQAMSQVLLAESLFEENDSVAAAWLGYALSRFNWVRDNAPQTMNKYDYRKSFEEELQGRGSLVKIWQELKEKDSSLKNTYLDEALMIYEAGYLKEYVWLYLGDGTWKNPPAASRLKKFMRWQDKKIPNHQVQTLANLAFESE